DAADLSYLLRKPKLLVAIYDEIERLAPGDRKRHTFKHVARFGVNPSQPIPIELGNPERATPGRDDPEGPARPIAQCEFSLARKAPNLSVVKVGKPKRVAI